MKDDKYFAQFESDFSLIDDTEAWYHPAFASFKKAMEGRAYGREALNDAWDWFKAGWEATFE